MGELLILPFASSLRPRRRPYGARSAGWSAAIWSLMALAATCSFVKTIALNGAQKGKRNQHDRMALIFPAPTGRSGRTESAVRQRRSRKAAAWTVCFRRSGSIRGRGTRDYRNPRAGMFTQKTVRRFFEAVTWYPHTDGQEIVSTAAQQMFNVGNGICRNAWRK